MLLVLLLISLVSCDWVEISQNTYKKEAPRRAMQSINSRYEEKLKDNRIYRNNLTIEKQWNKATIDRVTNIGNIRRVHEPSVRTPSLSLRPNQYVSTKLTDNTNVNNRHGDSEYPYLSIPNPFHEKETRIKWRGTTHREFTTRPSDINISTGEDKKVSIIGSDENKIFKEQDKNKKFGIITDESTEDGDDLQMYRIKNFQRLPTTGQNLPENILKFKHNFVSTTPVTKTSIIDAIFDKDNTNYFQKIENFNEEDLNESSLRNDFKFSNISIKTKSKFHVIKVDELPFVTGDDRVSKLDENRSSNSKDSDGAELNTNFQEITINNENLKETKKKDVIDRLEEISNANKGEAMGKMWNIVKIVTDTIYKNTHRSFKSKVTYLEGLKSTILTSIEEHFENVWPDDVEHRSYSRRARSTQARGHVEFPSSESTLMSISFLTFAVFLIKLVLQVIHTYKNKTMMVSPAMVAAVGRAAAKLRSQS
ncbi:unnamed protein product [Euphydryas editha]|uniref:Uncharacterized protein n=1 Tax=Euphydryas editha TaxID=104508 RepID=A0AAU9U5W6_EUPED|nr:unnamed protein product [Euphydryas editha]